MTGEPWPLGTAIAVFLLAGVMIGIVGARLVRIADRLADRTGWGEAIFGAVFIGATTSLPGLVTSVTAAAHDFPELAVSNAIGGIAAQTAFLSVADIAYRRANLEHAAAEPENMIQGALLAALLSLVLGTALTPPISIWGIHPLTLVLPLAYVGGIRIIRDAQVQPMWQPHETPLTRPDVRAAPDRGERVAVLWLRFMLYAAVLAVAGWLIARAGESVAVLTGLTETGVGALLTAIATSLPELFTAIAAVRAGALTLAVGNILGGNFFDTLFVAAADVAYRPGSIYHVVSGATLYLIALALLLTSVLLIGLLRRERHGIWNIGLESFLILVLFVAGYVVLFVISDSDHPALPLRRASAAPSTSGDPVTAHPSYRVLVSCGHGTPRHAHVRQPGLDLVRNDPVGETAHSRTPTDTPASKGLTTSRESSMLMSLAARGPRVPSPRRPRLLPITPRNVQIDGQHGASPRREGGRSDRIRSAVRADLRRAQTGSPSASAGET